MGGNLTHWQPQFSRIDASYGHVLLNSGNRQWKYLPNAVSGIMTKGDIRDIKEMDINNQSRIIFLANDELPLMYSLKKK